MGWPGAVGGDVSGLREVSDMRGGGRMKSLLRTGLGSCRLTLLGHLKLHHLGTYPSKTQVPEESSRIWGLAYPPEIRLANEDSRRS